MNDWKANFETEVKFLCDSGSFTAEQARTQAIIHWMRHGDFRPLAAAIVEGQPLDKAIGRALEHLAVEGRLKILEPGRLGAPRDRPGMFTRDVRMYLEYKKQTQLGSSDAAFEKIARDFGVSLETVRRAVTKTRRLREDTPTEENAPNEDTQESPT
jgi:hypothetical protein